MDEEIRQYCVNFIRSELAVTLHNNLGYMIRNARDNNVQIINYEKQKVEIESAIQKMNQMDINETTQQYKYEDDIISNPDDIIDDTQQ